LAVSLASAAMTANQGETKTTTVTLARGGGFRGAVDLAVTGAPAGRERDVHPRPAPTPHEHHVGGRVRRRGTGQLPPDGARRRHRRESGQRAPHPHGQRRGRPTLGLAADAGAVSVPAGASRTTLLAVSRGGGYAGAVALSAPVVGDAPGLSATVTPANIGAGSGTRLGGRDGERGRRRGPRHRDRASHGQRRGRRPATVDLPVSVLVPAVAVTAPAAASVVQGGAVTAAVAFSRTDFAGDVSISAEDPAGRHHGHVGHRARGAELGRAQPERRRRERPRARRHSRCASPARGGSPSATTTLPLTVTAAQAAASYTLAAAPSPVAVTAGGPAATATVTIGRTNFDGRVTLAASGAPAGLTVTLPNGPVTATSAALGVQAGAGLAAGDYPVTITGAAQGLANVTATLLVRVGAAGGGNNGGGAVRVTFCESDAPVWVAAQNGDGAWTRLTAVAPRQYDVTFAQRGALAAVTRSGDDVTTDVRYLSASELATLGQAGCYNPRAGGHTVNASVAGLATGQLAMASLGAGSGFAWQNGPFQIQNVADGTFPLVATRADAQQLVDRVILRRGVTAGAGATLPLLDFGSDEAFAPAAATVTVANLGAEQATLISSFYGGTLGGGLLATKQGGATLGYVGLPAARLQAGEFNMLMVGGGNASGSGPQRFVTQFARDVADRTVTLGAVLSAPSVGTAATAPYLRPRLTLPAQADYGAYASVSFAQTSAGSGRRDVSVSRSAASAGGTAPTTWDLSVPDFSDVAGFDAAWGLRATASTRWDVLAFGGSIGTLYGGRPADGDSYRQASRSGNIGTIIVGNIQAARSPAEASPVAQAHAVLARLADVVLARARR
jgi:hypothetical protein